MGFGQRQNPDVDSLALVEVPEHQRNLWFHDLLDENGKPFDIDELALIAQCVQPDGEPE